MALIDLFRKPQQSSKPVKKKSGFFSFSSASKEGVEDVRAAALQAFMQRTFQVDHKSMVVIDETGAPVKDASGQMVAADSADIQSVKSFNAGIEYLPTAQLGFFASFGFIGYPLCAMLYQHWFIKKACEMPAKDLMRNGYDITVNDGTEIKPEILEAMRKSDKRYKVARHVTEFIRMGRCFGFRVVLFKVNSPDPLYYEKPFNPDGITPGSYKGIVQVDPYWITPVLDQQASTNPASLHFYEPTWWQINGKRYHHTHLIIFKNGEVPDMLKPTYRYGGIPLPQMIAERVYCAERTANEAPLLAMSKRMTVLNCDTEKALANFAEFEQKMTSWASLQNNFGVKVIGGQETIQQYDTSLADLDAVIMTQYQIACAIAETPSTKMLGTQPKGFGATGEYDEASYHEFLESLQEDCTPLVDRHHVLDIRSNIAPKFGVAPFSVEINWNPTDSPTAAELAEINSKKAATDKTLADAGAIDGVDIRRRLINDKDSEYNGIEEEVPGQIEAIGEPTEGEDVPTETALDGLEFSPTTGTYNGAHLITKQSFLDPEIVALKRAAQDYVVDVTPEFMIDGIRCRMIQDGHHSLTAAVLDEEIPIFREIGTADIFNAVTRIAADAENGESLSVSEGGGAVISSRIIPQGKGK